MFLRAIVLAVAFAWCFLLVGRPAAAGVPSLAHRLESIVDRPAYGHAEFGMAIYDLNTNRTIFTRNANRFFLAASTTKLLTEGTALHYLGPGYRFRTNVYRTGPIEAHGVLSGDVVLVASGDPNLSGRMRANGTLAYENDDHSYDGGPDTRAVPGDPLAVLRSFAVQIADEGIKRITGRVIVDDSLFPGGFTESGTGATVSPIMINDNIIDVTVKPGVHPGDAASIEVSPKTPYATFIDRARTSVTGARRSIVLDDADVDTAGVHTVLVTGSIPAGSPPILYAYDVPSPRRFAEIAFTHELQKAGVHVAQTPFNEPPDHAKLAPAYTPGHLIATHLSSPLSQDVKVTLKVSDNLHADVMPYLWGGGSLQTAFDRERTFLADGHLNTSDVVQSDGLGGQAFIAPAFMVRYLAYIRKQSFFPAIYHGLPILGVDGTLFNVETHSPAAGKVRAKTGSWSASDLLNHRGMITGKGLAGYMTTKSGRHLAFCFYLNDFAVRHGQNADDVAGELLGKLATMTYLYANS